MNPNKQLKLQKMRNLKTLKSLERKIWGDPLNISPKELRRLAREWIDTIEKTAIQKNFGGHECTIMWIKHFFNLK